MGRPSVQKQRREEVLDAFLTVVARFGVEGATLERIAAEAGLKRPLIRHHLGNRDDMVRALADHVVTAQIAMVDELRVGLADYPGTRTFVDTLYGVDSDGDPRLNNAYLALVMVIEHYPDLREPLLGVMSAFYALARDIVRAAHPKASDADCEAVAHGIVDLYLSMDSQAPLCPPRVWSRASYRASLRLADSLTV